MEYINLVLSISSFLTLIIVGWDKVRATRLSARLDGNDFLVPKDELKESYRRAALAEASRLAGGKRVDIEVHWEGYTLVCTTKK